MFAVATNRAVAAATVKTPPREDGCRVNHLFILSVAAHDVGEGCGDDRTFQRVTEEMGEDVSPH